MKIVTNTVIWAALIISLNTKADVCKLYFNGINPVSDKAPYIEFVAMEEKVNRSETELLKLEEIRTEGINKFVSRVLKDGNFFSLTLNGHQFNLLDIGILLNADIAVLDRLIEQGYNFSSQSMQHLVLSTSAKSILHVIKKSQQTFSETLFAYHNEKLSLSNLLIKKGKIEVLEHLKEENFIDIASNLLIGDLIDIFSLTVETRYKLSNLVDLGEYKIAHEERLNYVGRKLAAQQRFDSDYSVYKLNGACNKDASAFVVDNLPTKRYLLAKVASESILIENLTYKDIGKYHDDPIFQEYLLSLYLKKQSLDSHPGLKIKTVQNIESHSYRELEQLHKQENLLVIDHEGRTLSEYLFWINKTSWKNDPVFMNVRRLAHYIIKKDVPLNSALSAKTQHIEFGGKNFSYYLLEATNTSKKMESILSNFPLPKSSVGINPKELLLIKLALNDFDHKHFRLKKKEIDELYQDRYTNRYQVSIPMEK